MKPPKYTSLPDRFWSKVADTPDENGCWIWIASTNKYGYGQYGIKAERSHRVSAADANGGIPIGLFVLHTCDVRHCVNPAHLYFGTHQDNMNDMVNRGRTVPRSSLTADDVIEIRRLYATGSHSLRRLGSIYSVSHTSIMQITKRRNWKHVS